MKKWRHGEIKLPKVTQVINKETRVWTLAVGYWNPYAIIGYASITMSPIVLKNSCLPGILNVTYDDDLYGNRISAEVIEL